MQMPSHPRNGHDPEKDSSSHTTANYDASPHWRSKPLTPAQVLVHDIRLESLRPDRGPMLEVTERQASSLVPTPAAYTPSASLVRAADAASNPIEERRFVSLEEQYGWIRNLRLGEYQQSINDPECSAKLRWVHVSSKFPEYLSGFLYALTEDITTVSDCMRLLDTAVQRHQRFSKHGKHFVPFVAPLSSQSDGADAVIHPTLISTPWLDWSINGETPPLRFQVDKREGFHSAKSSSHILRSILQYYFRLEDTRDREKSQVFSIHKPWTTNRELDLQIRQWYGHHPTKLTVDELWILAVDAEHIVTFSSNQSWKSRWPPLQLTSRISDVSFRDYRNLFYRTQHDASWEYTAITHAINSLAGAIGMMHRNFWPDIPLCLTDRYAGHLGHLQYRLHRRPSTKLVMDLIACQEELNIVIQITQQQLEMLTELQSVIGLVDPKDDCTPAVDRSSSSSVVDGRNPGQCRDSKVFTTRQRATFKQTSASTLPDPLAQLIDNLQRELADLQDLRDNANTLINRTIQLVNIRLEDHGKAILVFTVVTIVFLPLNFVTSFFGMNFSDIRNLDATQSLFWAVALCVTASVVGASIFLAFQGGEMLERLHSWRDSRTDTAMATGSSLRHSAGHAEAFRTLDRNRVDSFRP